MKICVIASFPVLPAHGGNRARLLALMTELAATGHQVHFVYMPSRTVRDFDRGLHAAAFGTGNCHWLRRGGVAEIGYYARRAAGKLKRKMGRKLRRSWGYYHGLDTNFFSPFLEQLHRLQQREAFDAVVVTYVAASRALTAFGDDVLKVLDTHDAFADRHLINAVPDGFSLTTTEEARGLRRADIVLAIQEAEAATFRAQLGRDAGSVRVVSHIMDQSARISDPQAAGIFVGSYFDANVASLRYLTQQIMPLIVRANPAFQVFVVGGICAAAQAGPNVRLLGQVSHMREAFAKGGIGLNPIVKGTGLNIKLLDAMAFGVPSVSTAFGARGLDETSRAGIVVVADNDPEAFSRAVLDLAADDERRAALGILAAQRAELWNRTQRASLADVFRDKARAG
jgi:glycosyltransferase involved in cell wall biosynthesis